MSITAKYWGKDCFGHYGDREDTCDNPTQADIRKAFYVLQAAASNALETEWRVVYWDSLDDYNQLIVTERVYTAVTRTIHTYDDRKVALPALRREWMDRVNGKEVK